TPARADRPVTIGPPCATDCPPIHQAPLPLMSSATACASGSADGGASDAPAPEQQLDRDCRGYGLSTWGSCQGKSRCSHPDLLQGGGFRMVPSAAASGIAQTILPEAGEAVAGRHVAQTQGCLHVHLRGGLLPDGKPKAAEAVVTGAAIVHGE